MVQLPHSARSGCYPAGPLRRHSPGNASGVTRARPELPVASPGTRTFQESRPWDKKSRKRQREQSSQREGGGEEAKGVPGVPRDSRPGCRLQATGSSWPLSRSPNVNSPLLCEASSGRFLRQRPGGGGGALLITGASPPAGRATHPT